MNEQFGSESGHPNSWILTLDMQGTPPKTPPLNTAISDGLPMGPLLWEITAETRANRKTTPNCAVDVKIQSSNFKFELPTIKTVCRFEF